MIHNSTFSVKFRRRRLGKTNFRKRLALLKSGRSRLVVRFTNRYVILQVVNYSPTGDLTRYYVNSSSLKSFGWNHSFKNKAASYLAGFLLGKNCKSNDLILDSGISKPTIRVFCILKGILDSGVSIAHSEEVIPSDDIFSVFSEDFNNVKNRIGDIK